MHLLRRCQKFLSFQFMKRKLKGLDLRQSLYLKRTTQAQRSIKGSLLLKRSRKPTLIVFNASSWLLSSVDPKSHGIHVVGDHWWVKCGLSPFDSSGTGIAKRRLRLRLVSLNGDFLHFLELGVKQVQGLMVLFPLGSEVVELFGVGLVSEQIFEMFFQSRYTFVFSYHFLEVTSALSGGSISHVIRQCFKDFAEPKQGHHYFLFLLEEKITSWQLTKTANLKFYYRSHFPSAPSLSSTATDSTDSETGSSEALTTYFLFFSNRAFKPRQLPGISDYIIIINQQTLITLTLISVFRMES